MQKLYFDLIHVGLGGLQLGLYNVTIIMIHQ